MICCTSRLSRSLSIRIRPENRCTASGSSAASATASASRISAPIGVFSSWLTLATKSRRIASTRRSLVRSSTSTSTSRLPSGATRAATYASAPSRAADDLQVLLADLAVAADRPDQVEQVLDHQPLAADDAEHVRRGAGLEHLVLRADHDARTSAAPTRTVATPVGTIGSGDSGIVRWARSLSITAPSESRARAAPMTPPSTAASVGSTATMRTRATSRDRPNDHRMTGTRPNCSSGVHHSSPSGNLDGLRSRLGGYQVGASRSAHRDTGHHRSETNTMRDTYHEQLDDILAELERMTRTVSDRRTTLHHRTAGRRHPQGRRGHRRGHPARRRRRGRRGEGLRADGPAAAGRERAADAGRGAADGRRPGADGRPGRARRQDRPAALPDAGHPGRAARRHRPTWARSPSHMVDEAGDVIADPRRRGRPASSRPTTTRWTSCAPTSSG